MKTASWFTKIPPGHVRIGISRGTPRYATAGYRTYRALAPGTWFHSVDVEEYNRLYQTQILGKLDPRKVAADLAELARGEIPVLLCYERAGPGQWCHRAMAADWLAQALGRPVPELGQESLPQWEHPLMPPELRRMSIALPPVDVAAYIGREAVINGELHRIVGFDLTGGIEVRVGERQFTTSTDSMLHYFTNPA